MIIHEGIFSEEKSKYFHQNNKLDFENDTKSSSSTGI